MGRTGTSPLPGWALLAATLSLSFARAREGVTARIPVFALSIADCGCAPEVTLHQHHGGTLPQCNQGGVQTSCFNGEITKFPGDDDVPGTCQIAPTGEPPATPCPGPPSSCFYASRKLTVSAAPCATSGCGIPSWQLHNTDGDEVGPRFTVGSDPVSTSVSIGNEACGTAPPGTFYDCAIKDSLGNTIVTMRITVLCKNCTP